VIAVSLIKIGSQRAEKIIDTTVHKSTCVRIRKEKLRTSNFLTLYYVRKQNVRKISLRTQSLRIRQRFSFLFPTKKSYSE
jgi:hypothetical protein